MSIGCRHRSVRVCWSAARLEVAFGELGAGSPALESASQPATCGNCGGGHLIQFKSEPVERIELSRSRPPPALLAESVVVAKSLHSLALAQNESRVSWRLLFLAVARSLPAKLTFQQSLLR